MKSKKFTVEIIEAQKGGDGPARFFIIHDDQDKARVITEDARDVADFFTVVSC